jgi:predicted ribosome quality control (RQC) complex YloA/Tae2 family protein
MGLTLTTVRRNIEFGRLIEFVFTSDNKTLTLEAHLFPQGKNIKIKTKDALICLKKPQDLVAVQAQTKIFEKRSVAVLYSEWLEQFEQVGKEASPNKIQVYEQVVAKKRKGLDKLLENQKILMNSEWPEFAEWLNVERVEDVPKKYAEMYNHKQSVVENIENAFAESKKVKAKLANLNERIEVLKKEIVLAEKVEAPIVGHMLRPRDNPLEGAKGRTREFNGDIRAYIGKSGTDNLKLLRQSKSWYVWVHAKDWPSAHAIIACNKGQQIPPRVLRDVCLWVLKETISDKQWQSWRGIKVDFLYTERRFLQPIKGDHHGRVRYTEAKTLTLVVE